MIKAKLEYLFIGEFIAFLDLKANGFGKLGQVKNDSFVKKRNFLTEIFIMASES
jgi:hypothetical protein